MKTLCRELGHETLFLMTDLSPAEQGACQHLQYVQYGESYGRAFASGTPHLAQIYATFERVADEMLHQAARLRPIPWERALDAFFAIIDGQRLDWWLTGSAALAVRGIDIEPGDVDLITDDASAQRLGELLLPYLFEPVVPVSGWICRWWGRAFLHARLEWVGGLVGAPDPGDTSDASPLAATRLETVRWRGHVIQVAPLDLQLITSRKRGLLGRVALIEHHMQGHTAG